MIRTFSINPKEIAERCGWQPRRLNPVLAYLLERQLIIDYAICHRALRRQ
jgi:hypothetical protein